MSPVECAEEIGELEFLIRFETMKERTCQMTIIVCGRDYDAIPEVKERLFEAYDRYDPAAIVWVNGSEPWEGSAPDKITCEIVRMAHEVY